VIASRVGAMAELVEDQKSGLHFEAGNPDDLAAKVAWAWNHPLEMETIGLAARAEYMNKYTAARNYDALMRIYHAAIQRKAFLTGSSPFDCSVMQRNHA
jgi:glycosyltransferase involved in cell wall biosynthesis